MGLTLQTDPGAALVARLAAAVSAHDLEAVVSCFAADYRNETPAHPFRSFSGRGQVRTNWSRLFAGVPDIEATIVATASDGERTWTEWILAGTRLDGRREELRGVIVFGVVNGVAAWARFYLEPVDQGPGGVDAAVTDIVGTDVPR